MAVLKCKMCGAQIKIEQNESTATCRYCDSVQTIPKIDDENKLKLYERATELRLRCDFDQASSVFQSIVAQFPEEAEAYWGICLCRYGIEYVDDPVSFMKIPTCHRTNSVSILADEDYLNTLSLAGTAKWKYEEEAEAIDKLQKKILEICKNEQPYDVFICYKETDEKTGLRTEDSLSAQDIYTELIKNNYRVFFSRITLRGKAGSEYEPYIYSALSTAKVMLVIGSKKEYLEAVWLKNEWSRYLDMIPGSDKIIVPCFEKITAEDIPARLKSFQGLDMGNKIFFSDLIHIIGNVCQKSTAETENKKTEQNHKASDIQKKEFDYKDGAYSGEAIGTRPHGYGIRYYMNGDRYEGFWHMGVKQGEGTFFYADGKKWQGIWNDNTPVDGNGTYVFHRKDTEIIIEGTVINKKLNGEGKHYQDGKPFKEGMFRDGKLNGKGKYYQDGKLFKEGMFKDDELDGEGIFYNTDGSSCRGEFRKDSPFNASGTFPINVFSRKSFFTGTWCDGKATGKGTIVTADGKFRVEGVFTDSYTGKVKVICPNTNVYEGDMQDSEVTGNGKLSSADGRLIYEGTFKNAKYHGEGIFYSKNGQKYVGTFVDDHPDKCVRYNADGTVNFEGTFDKDWNPYTGTGTIKNNSIHFEGKVTNGKPTGFCKFFYPDGSLKIAGHYTDGMLTKGTLFYENGDKYSGEFENDLPCGHGIYTYDSPPWKGSWTGEWCDGQRVTGKGLLVVCEDGERTGGYYEGNMLNGAAHGKGVYVQSDGKRFVGELYYNKYYNGTLYAPDNSVIGTFRDGVGRKRFF